MRIVKVVGIALALAGASGCDEGLFRADDGEPPYASTVGEEVPPPNIRGRTFSVDSLAAKTVRERILWGLNWATSILLNIH